MKVSHGFLLRGLATVLAPILLSLGCDRDSNDSVPAVDPSATGPVWFCENPIYDLGTVFVGEPFEIVYKVQNRGVTDLKILAAVSSCGCASTGEFDRLIAPGSTGKIPFVITTRNLGFEKLDKKVTIHTNDPNRRKVDLGLRGIVLERIQVSPWAGAVFGRVDPGGSYEREVKITNHMEKPLDLKLRPQGAIDSFSRTFEVIDPGREFLLKVGFEAPLLGGTIRENILLETGTDDPKLLKVHCIAFVPRRLEVIPVSLVLPERQEAEFRRTLRVFSYQGRAVKILGVTFEDPRVEVEVRQVPESMEAQIDLVFPPGFEMADERLLLSIKIDDEVLPELKVSVRPRPKILTGAPR